MSDATPSHFSVKKSEPASAEKGTLGLRERALRGSIWTVGAFFIKSVLRFGSNILLAYLLFPEAFALMALCAIVLQGLEMLTDVGIRPAVVQSQRGNDPAFLNTAWTMQVVRGFLLWVAASALAWPVAEFYQEPQLRVLVPVCAIASITTGLQSIGMVTEFRKVILGRLVILGLCETALKTLIMVVWALISPSVWALAGGSIITFAISSAATHVMFPGVRHRFTWDRDAVAELLHFGRWIFVSTLMTYLSQQTDRIILGKLLPMSVLGVYSISYSLARLPLDIAGNLTGAVLYPALAEIVRHDRASLGNKLRESRDMIFAATQFGIVGVIVASPWFFEYLYDARYADAAYFTPLLSVAIWISILQGSAVSTLLALAAVRNVALSNLLNCPVTAGGCLLGYSYFGMPGFIAGVAVGNLAGYSVLVWSLARHGIRVIRQDLVYSGLIVAIMLVCVVIPHWLLGAVADQPLMAVALATIGLAVSGLVALRRVGPTIFRHIGRSA